MTKFTVFLDGTLTTVSPFANSPAGNKGRNDEALLPRLPINIGGAFKAVPVIQASTLRGKIRRAAAYVVLDRMLAAGERVGFDDWLLWALGGVKGSGKENIDIRRRQDIIESCALLAMFGAGTSQAGGMVGGRFLIDPAIPNGDVPTAIVAGARAAENRNPALTNFLDAEEMELVQAYTDANRDRSDLRNEVKKLSGDIKRSEKAHRENRKAALTLEEIVTSKSELARIEARLAEAERVSGELTSTNPIGRPLPGYEVIPSGVMFPHRMTIKAASMEQVGFVIESLREFAVDPTIGAHVSSGCGRIAARYDVRIRRDRERAVENVGSMAYGDHDGLVLEGGFLDGAVTAWAASEFVPGAYRADS